MSRRCRKCPTSSMRDGRVHLHELQPGDWFRFPGKEGALRVKHVGEATVMAAGTSSREPVAFTTATGEEVSFTSAGRSVRHIAPAAEVVRLSAEVVR